MARISGLKTKAPRSDPRAGGLDGRGTKPRLPREHALIRCAVLTATASALLWTAIARGEAIAAAELRGSGAAAGLVPNGLLVPGAGAQPARAPFEGTLHLTETRMTTHPAQFQSARVLGKETQLFPGAAL